MARDNSESQRLTNELVAEIKLIQTKVESRIKVRPSVSTVIEAWSQFADQQVIVDALIERLKPPNIDDLKEAVQKAKAKKARAKT